jgi:predicted  nucleic acid-binding Zn-ribbon protein
MTDLMLGEFAKLNVRVDDLEKRMTKLEERMTKLESRMDRLEERMDSLEKRMDKLELRFNKFESDTERNFAGIYDLITFVGNKVWDEHEGRIKTLEYGVVR